MINFLVLIEDAGYIHQFVSETLISFFRVDQINKDDINFYPLECNFNVRICSNLYS
jgi:hypothetical protein